MSEASTDATAFEGEFLRAVEAYGNGRRRGTAGSTGAAGSGSAADGAGVAARAAGPLLWQSLLECEIVRCLETRTEREREQAGPVDLGGREVYGHLGRHRLPPPADPGQRERFELVRRGSLRERACACGNGRWTCESCGGGGQLSCPTSASCPSCAGTCHAEAYPERPPHLRPRTPGCPRCGRSGTACGRCKGRGTVRCDSCGGTGSTRCRSCGGGGTVAHSACAGTGRFSSWKEAVVKRKPAKAAVRLPDPPPPYLVRRRARGAGLWWSAVVDGYGPLPAGLQPEHAQAITPHLDRRETEIARRVTVRHLPLARVVVADEPHRHYYAFPGRAGVEVVRVPSPRQMNRFAWIGAASMGLAAAAALLVLALAR